MILEELDNKIIKKLDRLNIYTTEEKKTELDNSLLSLSETISLNNNEFIQNNNSISPNKLSIFKNMTPELEFDKSEINFGICFPGESVKKKLKIKNKSRTEKTVIDISFLKTENFPINVTKDKQEFQVNSHHNYKCFSIVLNSDKESTLLNEKKYLLKENEEIEIEINLTNPFIKKKENIFGILQIFNNKILLENGNILLSAAIEIPKLLCLKSITSDFNEIKMPLLSLMLEIKSKGQKFRIPFKNLSAKDINVQFSLDLKNNSSIFQKNHNLYECQFLFFPSSISIGSHATGYIDIIAKIKKAKLDENVNESLINDKVRKVIVAKIKNSIIFYPFFVEAHFKV